MNTEIALDRVKTILTNNLSATLIVLQMEAESTTVTPTPQEFKVGEFIEPDIISTFPFICVYSPSSLSKNDYSNFQDRTININVLSWIVENDVETLHRFLVRYGEGIQRILRNESNFSSLGFHNPVVKNAENTDLYKTDVQYAQGVLVQFDINYILGEN